MSMRLTRFTTMAITLAPVLLSSACTAVDAHRKCGFGGCAGDARITAAVESRLHQNAAIADWEIRVQTIDATVYLYGLVDTDLQRIIIVDTAREIPGVVNVVDSIAVRNNVY